MDNAWGDDAGNVFMQRLHRLDKHCGNWGEESGFEMWGVEEATQVPCQR